MSAIRERIIASLNTFSGDGVDFDRSTLIRSIWFDYGIFLGSKNLITGYGAGGFWIFSGLATYAHSNFAEILCNFGVIGFIFFYGFLIMLFVLALKKKSESKAFIISFAIYYMIIGFSNVFYYKKMYFLILAIMVAICIEKPESVVEKYSWTIKELISKFCRLVSHKPKYLDLMYITNNVEAGKIAQKCGVNRIWIDLETIGKEERQKGLNTVKSKHSIEDVRAMKAVLKKSSLQVRINPIHKNSAYEIEKCIEYGADYIMLPMWKTPDEVKQFIKLVNKRAKTILLLETKEARECLDDVLLIDGIDEIHIGLNDLHLSYNLNFMFELLSNGTVEELCQKIKKAKIKYGFGGFSNFGDGLVPAQKIVAEHYRLGSSQAILSRGFVGADYNANKQLYKRNFKKNIKQLRRYEKKLQKWNFNDFDDNKNQLYYIIEKVALNDV